MLSFPGQRGDGGLSVVLWGLSGGIPASPEPATTPTQPALRREHLGLAGIPAGLVSLMRRYAVLVAVLFG